MYKYQIAFYVAIVLVAVLANVYVDPQQAALVSQQLTNAESGITVLN